MKKMIFWGISIFAMLFLISCAVAKPTLSELNSNGYKEITKDDIKLEWKIDGANLRVTVKAPTTGWVAVGFAPTDVHAMKSANIIIGYVKDGQVFIENDFGTGWWSHKPKTEVGGKNDVIESSGKEADGYTEINFSMPLNSGDTKDQVLIPGNNYRIILAYGSNDADNFTMHHKKAISLIVTL